jgi:hypothetical protein
MCNKLDHFTTKEKDFAGRIGSLWSQVANEVAEFGYATFVQVASHLLANCNFFCPFLFERAGKFWLRLELSRNVTINTLFIRIRSLIFK